MLKVVKKSRSLKILLLVIVAAAVILGVLEATNTTHFFHGKHTAYTAPSNSQAIKQLPPQPAANNGEKKSSPSSTINQGTATDNHGVSTVTTPSSEWTTSASGLLTVQQPAPNSTIKTGAVLSGTAKLDQVQYRLTDDKVGVVSQGTLSVVGGKFSGSINFQAYGSSGRLDVFSTDPNNGREINEVQLPVVF
ncbi:MAG TPA: hypothetical protein VII55_00855 [Candidatus Saccharimonadales bacterium]